VPLTIKGVGSSEVVDWHTACSILIENQQDLEAGLETEEQVCRALAATGRKDQPI
jgi:hypothetical protein